MTVTLHLRGPIPARPLLRWSEVTAKELESVLDRLFSALNSALMSAEAWTGNLSHRPTARKNFARNLRAAEVRYAAIRQLKPGNVWPHYEARLARLLQHEWAPK